MRCSSARASARLLVITRGFRDALRIATQARPRLFDRHIVLPEMLYERVIEAAERMGARGELIEPLDEAALSAEIADGLRRRPALLRHRVSSRLPLRSARIGRRSAGASIGFTQISVSHRVSPLMKLVPRGDTTVVDAYLSPILRRYVDGVAHLMPGVPLYFMQSSGGLTQARHFQGKDAILSGPAGGIVGMVRTAQAAGHSQTHRLRHGGHLHRCQSFCGRIRAHLRYRSRRSPGSRAHDEHSQHRGGRRLHHPLRWRAAARGSASPRPPTRDPRAIGARAR